MTDEKHTVVVAGLPRCGTSMMMHCLHLAGVPLAFTAREERARGREIFRNPAGFYEGRWNGESGLVKVLGPGAARLPNPRVVLMVRSVEAIQASWFEIKGKLGETAEANPARARRGRERTGTRKRKGVRPVRIGMVQRAAMVRNALEHSGKPFIVVDYDQFVTDPESYREDFSGLFPELDFERIKAGVDSSLYVRRATSDSLDSPPEPRKVRGGKNEHSSNKSHG